MDSKDILEILLKRFNIQEIYFSPKKFFIFLCNEHYYFGEIDDLNLTDNLDRRTETDIEILNEDEFTLISKDLIEFNNMKF